MDYSDFLFNVTVSIFMLLHVHQKGSIYSHHLLSHSPINGHDIVSTFSLLQIIPLGLFWHTAFSMFWVTSLAWSPRLKLQRQGKDDFCSYLAYWQIISQKSCTNFSATSNIFPRLDIDGVIFCCVGRKYCCLT